MRSQNGRSVTGTRPPIVTNHLENADAECVGQIEQILAKSSRFSRFGTRLVYLGLAKSAEKRPGAVAATAISSGSDRTP